MRVPTWSPRSLALLLLITGLASCVARDPMAPRVPDHRMKEAASLQAPFGDARRAPPDPLQDRAWDGSRAGCSTDRFGSNRKGAAVPTIIGHPRGGYGLL